MEDGLAIDARLQWFALAPPYGAADVATQLGRDPRGELPGDSGTVRRAVPTGMKFGVMRQIRDGGHNMVGRSLR